MSRLAVTRSDLVPSGVIAQPQYDSPWSGMGEGFSALPEVIRSVAHEREAQEREAERGRKAQEKITAKLLKTKITIDALEFKTSVSNGIEKAKEKAIASSSVEVLDSFFDELAGRVGEFNDPEVQAELEYWISTTRNTARGKVNKAIVAGLAKRGKDGLALIEARALMEVTDGPTTDADIAGKIETYKKGLDSLGEVVGPDEAATLLIEFKLALREAREVQKKNEGEKLADELQTYLAEHAAGKKGALEAADALVSDPRYKESVDPATQKVDVKVVEALVVGETETRFLKYINEALQQPYKDVDVPTLKRMVNEARVGKEKTDETEAVRRIITDEKAEELLARIDAVNDKQQSYDLTVKTEDGARNITIALTGAPGSPVAMLAAIDVAKGLFMHPANTQTFNEIMKGLVSPMLNVAVKEMAKAPMDRDFDPESLFAAVESLLPEDPETEKLIATERKLLTEEKAKRTTADKIADLVLGGVTVRDAVGLTTLGFTPSQARLIRQATDEEREKAYTAVVGKENQGLAHGLELVRTYRALGLNAPRPFLDTLNNSLKEGQTTDVSKAIRILLHVNSYDSAWADQLWFGVPRNKGMVIGINAMIRAGHGLGEIEAVFEDPFVVSQIGKIHDLQKEGELSIEYEALPGFWRGVGDVLGIGIGKTPQADPDDRIEIYGLIVAEVAKDARKISFANDPNKALDDRFTLANEEVLEKFQGRPTVETFAGAPGGRSLRYLPDIYGITGGDSENRENLENGFKQLAVSISASEVFIYGAEPGAMASRVEATGYVALRQAFRTTAEGKNDAGEPITRTVVITPSVRNNGISVVQFLEYDVNTGEHQVIDRVRNKERWGSLQKLHEGASLGNRRGANYMFQLPPEGVGKYITEIDPTGMQGVRAVYTRGALKWYYDTFDRPPALPTAKELEANPELGRDLQLMRGWMDKKARENGSAGFTEMQPPGSSAPGPAIFGGTVRVEDEDAPEEPQPKIRPYTLGTVTE